MKCLCQKSKVVQVSEGGATVGQASSLSPILQNATHGSLAVNRWIGIPVLSGGPVFRDRLEACPTASFRLGRAFTLIEIMVVIGIMAVVMTIAVPFFAREKHRDSMRKAVEDVTEMCREARNRAVLNGHTMELRIRPGDKTFSVASGTAAVSTSDGNPVAAPVNDSPNEGVSLTRKLSDHIQIENIQVNFDTDLHMSDQCGALFRKNGTSDAVNIVLRSDIGEVRVIRVDPINGIPEVDVK